MRKLFIIAALLMVFITHMPAQQHTISGPCVYGGDPAYSYAHTTCYAPAGKVLYTIGN